MVVGSPRVRALALGSIVAAIAGCRSRPTQLTLLLDSNVAPTRAQQLTMTALYGEQTLSALARAEGAITRLHNGERAIFPGSVAIVHNAERRASDVVTVLAVLDVAAARAQPALRVERLQRVRLIDRVPLQGRLYFNADCAAASAGCTSVEPSACTVSRRCIEQGLTCGDDGTCVGTELPVVVVPPETPLDATVVDGASRDARAMDAASDAAVDVTSDASNDASNLLIAARPIAPLSASTVTSQRPTLRWEMPAGATGALLSLCLNRAMSVGCAAPIRLAGDRARTNLSQGVWFWRVSAVTGAREHPASPVWQLRVGARSADGDRDTSWGTESDFNGDGATDVVVGAPNTNPRVMVFNGSAAPPMAPSQTIDGAGQARFGTSVAAADVNGDGFADLIVGAESGAIAGASGATGTITVLNGSPSGLLTNLTAVIAGTSAAGQFGGSVAGAGDVNGDGYADVIVGAYQSAPGGRASAGTATVFLGSASGLRAAPHRVLEGALAGDWFGFSVAGAGDVNGDGFADVIVGAYGADNEAGTNAGSASVYLGSASGLSATAHRVIEGATANAETGWSVAGAGDVNGDGYSDIVLGNPWMDIAARSDSGSARVHLGSATGVQLAPSRTWDGPTVNELFGWSVSSAGDVNSDGYSDVIVGAKDASPSGRVRAGSASVFLGGPTGPASVAATVLTGSGAGDAFGGAVACAGDFNGDRFSDVIVGAKDSSAGLMTGGAASLFVGFANGVMTGPLRVFAGQVTSGWFGYSVASALTVERASAARARGCRVLRGRR
jgi:hypothetical protein